MSMTRCPRWIPVVVIFRELSHCSTPDPPVIGCSAAKSAGSNVDDGDDSALLVRRGVRGSSDVTAAVESARWMALRSLSRFSRDSGPFSKLMACSDPCQLRTQHNVMQ